MKPREIDWHPYFVWFPINVLYGEGDLYGSWVWLRWVERRKWWIGPRTMARGDPDDMRWHYRSQQ